jgi:hypothetical protein
VSDGGNGNRPRIVVHFVDDSVVTHTKAPTLAAAQHQAVAGARFPAKSSIACLILAAFSGETCLLKDFSAGRSMMIL